MNFERREAIRRGCRRSARSVAARRVYFDALAALGALYPRALAEPIRPAAIARALRLLVGRVLPGSPAHRAIRHVLDYRSPRTFEIFLRRELGFVLEVREFLASQTKPPTTSANVRAAIQQRQEINSLEKNTPSTPSHASR